MRTKLQDKLEDMSSRCFICGIPKEKFEKLTNEEERFPNHVKVHHHIWNYLYYIAYLNKKDPTEYTGNESYVSENLKKNEINWFPIDR